jgi:hypothetical protein
MLFDLVVFLVELLLGNFTFMEKYKGSVGNNLSYYWAMVI